MQTTRRSSRTIFPHQRGFTLIELLVVIAIIAILAAILFPVFAKVRQKAWQANCAANGKQIAMAIRQYADDNDGYGPNSGWSWDDRATPGGTADLWTYKLIPYGIDPRTDTGWKTIRCGDRNGSYWSLPYGRGEGPRTYALEYNVKTPSEVMIAGETKWLYQPNLPPNWQFYTDFSCDGTGKPDHCFYAPPQAPHDEDAPHTGKVNMAFVDGHVKVQVLSQLYAGVRNFNPADYNTLGGARWWYYQY